MNIVLTGYRCSGKTSVGKILARKLKRNFTDSDAYLEKKCSTTISHVFKKHGEAYFRLLESDIIKELSKLDNLIMATGGGVVLKHQNMRNLKRNSVIIFLDVSAKTAYKRLLKDNMGRKRRPRFTDNDLLTELREQIAFRYPYYKRFADYTVKTDNKSIRSVAKYILEILKD